MNNFIVQDISYIPSETIIALKVLTNNPCHLTCYYTDKNPLRHRTARNQRGLTLPWGAYFCFVSWKSVEQIEPGDTLYHTFQIEPWEYCQTKYFAFRGTVTGVLSPSTSCLFQYHHSWLPPHIEEQTQYDLYHPIDPALFTSVGQRLIIPDRTLTKLGFWLMKEGYGWWGDVFFEINRVSNDSLIASKKWGAVGDVPSGEATYLEVTFDAPVPVNEEVRIFARVTGGDDDDHAGIYIQSSDVKAGEVFCRYRVFTAAWEVLDGYDCAYRYTYQ